MRNLWLILLLASAAAGRAADQPGGAEGACSALLQRIRGSAPWPAARAERPEASSIASQMVRHIARSNGFEAPCVFVFQSPAVQAIAGELPEPRGSSSAVIVFSGLFQVAQNDSQLAGVLAHELAHLRLRHGPNRLQVRDLVDRIPGGPLSWIAHGGPLFRWKIMDETSRQAEDAADRVGQAYAARAGYDPHGLAAFLAELADRDPKAASPSPSHPAPKDRIDRLRLAPFDRTSLDAPRILERLRRLEP